MEILIIKQGNLKITHGFHTLTFIGQLCQRNPQEIWKKFPGFFLIKMVDSSFASSLLRNKVAYKVLVVVILVYEALSVHKLIFVHIPYIWDELTVVRLQRTARGLAENISRYK